MTLIRTPLRRSSGPTRRTPLRRVSAKRSAANRTRRALLAMEFASGASCEARLPGCTGVATDGHEVKTRARGGSILSRANIVLICRTCHGVITEHPDWALFHGWVVASWADETHEDLAWKVRSNWRCGLSCDLDHRAEFA